MRKVLLAGAAAFGLIGAASSAQAGVVWLSTFNGLQPYGTWGVHSSADGWTATSGAGIELQNHRAGSPADAANPNDVFVELDSHNNSSMSRTIADSGDYVLDFLYSPRPGRPASTNLVSIYLDGMLLSPPGTLQQAGGADTQWTAYASDVFSAKAGSVITFAAEGSNDSFGGYVDNIRLSTSAVPEPATWAMMTLGFVGTGALLRRRRQGAFA